MGTTVGMGDSDHAAVHLSVLPQAHYSRVFFLFSLSARGTDTAVIVLDVIPNHLSHVRRL